MPPLKYLTLNFMYLRAAFAPSAVTLHLSAVALDALPFLPLSSPREAVASSFFFVYGLFLVT